VENEQDPKAVVVIDGSGDREAGAGPPSPPVRKKRVGLRGCATALLLVLGFCSFSIWRLGEPRRRAMEAHPKIRPGMTLVEVYAVSGRWWSSNGAECGEAAEPLASFSASDFGGTGSGHLVLNRRKPGSTRNTYDTESIGYASRAELLKLVAQVPALSTCKRVGFTYLVSGVPPRTSFGVFFANGKVDRVSKPGSWD
jgi:hypothetical protein